MFLCLAFEVSSLIGGPHIQGCLCSKKWTNGLKKKWEQKVRWAEKGMGMGLGKVEGGGEYKKTRTKFSEWSPAATPSSST